MLGINTQVTFDDVPRNESEKPTHSDGPSDALDYSPLPRITGRSLAMALLVSMGGLIFGQVFAHTSIGT